MSKIMCSYAFTMIIMWHCHDESYRHFLMCIKIFKICNFFMSANCIFTYHKNCDDLQQGNEDNFISLFCLVLALLPKKNVQFFLFMNSIHILYPIHIQQKREQRREEDIAKVQNHIYFIISYIMRRKQEQSVSREIQSFQQKIEKISKAQWPFLLNCFVRHKKHN